MIKKLYFSFLMGTIITGVIAQAPALPLKDLSVNKVFKQTAVTTADGYVKAFDFKNLEIDVEQGYTIEFRARVNSETGRGLDIESRNDGRSGFRFSVGADGIRDYFQPGSPVVIDNTANNDDYHTYRLAVKADKVHLYKDDTFLTTKSLGFLTKEDVMVNYNPGFESTDMSMWSLASGQTGRTTTEGEFRTGTAALKVGTSTQGTVATLTVTGLKPETSYGLAFWTKGIAMAGNMRFQLILGYYDSTNTFVQNSLSDWNEIKPNTTTWRLIGKPFLTAATDKVAIINIMGWNSSNTIVLDDFSITENEATPTVGNALGSNLITNGSFNTNADGWLLTGLGWPLGSASWSSTNEGQLQIKETNWGNNAGGAYSVNATVSPTKTYKLTAKTSQLISGTYYNRIVDGASKSEVSYAASANLASYTTNTTPPFTVGNSTTQVQLQFTTKTQHNSSTNAKVVMTLDDVVLQEYEAFFPAFITLGKLLGVGVADIQLDYFNYNLGGAYAPGVVDPNKVLWDSIEIAEDRLASVEIGNIPGKYPQSAYDIFFAAINLAKTEALKILNAQELNDAISALNDARQVFENAVSQGDYFPETVELTAYHSTIEQGEATTTALNIVMNNNQEVDFNFVQVQYVNLTPDIIETNEAGSVIGKNQGVGQLKVIVAYESHEKMDTVSVSVIGFDSMSFNLDEERVSPGDTITFESTLKFNNETVFTTPYQIVYSSNISVASVDDTGLIYATKEGEADITAYVRRGNIEKSITQKIIVAKDQTSVKHISNASLKVYPVPANNQLFIHVSEPKFQSIEVYNLSGMKLMYINTDMKSELIKVNVSQLENGVYILKMSGNDHAVFEKFTIKR